MEQINSENRKARKNHQCWGCGKFIQKGETYSYQFYKDCGDVWDVKCHIACQELINKYCEHFPDYDNDGVLPIYNWFEWNARATEYQCIGWNFSSGTPKELIDEWNKLFVKKGSDDDN